MLSHIRRGAGEPLVLIHGIGSQWQAWTAVLERLSGERDVVALDLPGFGGSAPLPGEVSLATLADAVRDLLDELGLVRAHVAGNSLGGARDRLLIPRQADRARDAMPRARHEWLAGCGRVPTRDDPEQVASVLLAGSRD